MFCSTHKNILLQFKENLKCSQLIKIYVCLDVSVSQNLSPTVYTSSKNSDGFLPKQCVVGALESPALPPGDSLQAGATHILVYTPVTG